MTDETLRAAMAERAARAGAVVAMERFREPLAVETKANKTDLVTAADRDAQQQIIATIRQEFPHATFVCEEDSRPPGSEDAIELADGIPETGRAWVVDPIDGTSNYVRGIRFWGTSVAAIADGEPVGVATYMPAEEDIYTAGPESVSLNDTTLAVSERSDPETFAVGLIGWWPGERTAQYTALFEAVNERFGDMRRLGCMQGVLALVAAGSLEGAIMPETPHPWDAIAGVHLIRRAGGTVTDIYGDRWHHGATGLVASNGECHDAMLEAVRESVDLEVAD